jgi:hypothetical protein
VRCSAGRDRQAQGLTFRRPAEQREDYWDFLPVMNKNDPRVFARRASCSSDIILRKIDLN